ncbi:MAG: xanthine dehydrogenase family protein molybdopterin-binding subunit [Acidimicrobiales bacterium]|nr:xanthine dehydrogenase family protein molybdopterin-binding subunit [Acidimicrobiales bacterium]HJM27493.1 xanthine dehydrogenase family protein molybdopterin-binding subunit [Acidimicrobiales bacterium]
MSLVGARVIRKEDPNLISGRGQFVDDVKIAGTAHMVFVRSIEAHARIKDIDVSAALECEGVIGVWTATNLELGPLPGVPGLERPALAKDKVRFVGEAVAVVVAENRYAAADGAELVLVDYEPLGVVTNIGDAIAENAPLLYEAVGSNTVMEVPSPDDHQQIIDEAPHSVSMHIVNNRCAPSPMEPMVCLADHGPSGLTLWASFQAPHHLRNTVSSWLGIAQDQCRVITPDVGGGFGAKVNFTPELFIAPTLSKLLGRPIKYTQTRSECMTQMYHGRAQEQDVDIAFDDEGKILALRVMVYQDQGGYADPTGMGLPALTTTMAAGCYLIPNVSVAWKNVVTNTTPVAAYRGAGRPEASYLIERAVDQIAYTLGIDPVEVRRRNYIATENFPYATHSEIAVYDSGNFAGCMNELLNIMDYDAIRTEQEGNRDDPTKPLLGVGFASWLEIAGFGPPGSLEGFGHLGSWESVQVRIQPDGSAIIYTGASPHGQGTVTTFAQIASDYLGIEFDKISVRHGDTATIPQGIGTLGSRAVAVGGEGVKTASMKIVERAKKVAAHLLEANPDDLIVEQGNFSVKGTPSQTVSWGEVAWTSFRPLEIPEDVEPGSLDTTVLQQVPNFSFPSGAYGCVVEIDKDTGDTRVRDMYLVDDCGTVISPMLAEGQVHGGVAQGIAQALYEEVKYDKNGQPTTGTFVDYLIPAAPELPSFTSGRICTPTPNNTLGAKGIGESGSVGAPPAVINAVVDALRHLDVTHVDMPATPQKIWRILQGDKK